MPGLGTALTRSAMKDIEEQGVKVGIIFNSVLKFIGTEGALRRPIMTNDDQG